MGSAGLEEKILGRNISQIGSKILTRWRAVSETMISQWSDFGPLAGSATVLKIDELFGSLAKPNVFARPFATIPVLFVVYWSIAASRRLGSLRNLSKVSSPFALKILGTRWSLKLAPTTGSSMRTGIFSALSSCAFPMPDNWSICVVPTVPADRMTSFRAFTIVGAEPPKETVIQYSQEKWLHTAELNTTERLEGAFCARLRKLHHCRID